MDIYYVEITEDIENTIGVRRTFVYYFNSKEAQKQFVEDMKKELENTCLRRITRKGVANFNSQGLLCPISW